jgi:AraC-like DNA-binding protein
MARRVLVPVQQDRLSDSPFVERIWHAHSEYTGGFTSVAMSHWEMVVTKLRGKTTLTVRGPETRPTAHHLPEDGEWLGIRFKLGTFIPELLPSTLIDQDLNLPNASQRSFWLNGSSWDFPDFENADFFVQRLVREGVLVSDPVVVAALRGELRDVSQRTARRHFVRTTGLSPNTARQIERARYATILLEEGMPLSDVAYEAGYFDQPHLTRSLKRFMDRTPSQIAGVKDSLPLSFLYKTAPLALGNARFEVQPDEKHNRRS